MEFNAFVGLGVFILLALVMLAGGMWVAFALGAAGLLGAAIFGYSVRTLAGATLFNEINSFTLTAVPLFILMGEIALKSGISRKMYRGVSRWTRVLPGGLLHSNIVSCAIFAAICGSSVATAATIGSVAVPEQERLGYKLKEVAASLIAGGTLGILIPPSIVMIVYGTFTGNSVAQLFLGGVIPGIILSAIFMIYIVVANLRDASIAPRPEKLTWHYIPEFFKAFKDIWHMVFLIVCVLGGIYGGFVTVTEAAALGCFLSLVIGIIFRSVNLQTLKEAGMATIRTTCMVLFIFAMCSILTNALSSKRIPAEIAAFIGGLGISRYIIWLLIIFLYTVLGMFMDAFAMILLTLPITYPIMMSLGFDPIWFGIALVLLVELGQASPPVGINLFVIHGIIKSRPFAEIALAVVPYCLLQLAMVAILTLYPNLALWLPRLAFK